MKNLIPALICLFLAIPCQAGTIYVDDDADVGGDGLSWGTAYKYLQDALLADATSGDQIWVAAGTYKPDQDEGGNVTPGNRNYSFKLINGVGIYGGFPSGGAWEDRDPNTYETILSGDIGVPDANNDNSYHVVVALWAEETAVLEGFAITGGNANGTAVDQKWGGGTLNIGSDPTVTNCTFTGNSAEDGGGMFNYNRSNPTVTNCTFTNNTVLGGGGGMYNEDRSNPMVTNCTFSGNEAAHGGGMFSRDSSSPTVSNCTFCANIANIDGGGMRNNSSDPTVTNCTFMGNSASKDGGGMYNASGSPTVTNCTFTNNTALGVSSGGGGGMHNNISNSEVTNCTFMGNSASKDGGGMENSNSDPTVTNCTFTGNSAVWDGGGMDNWASSPILTNCTFSGNEAGWLGGGMYNVSGSPSVTNCILWDNSDSGGTDESAQIHNLSSTPVINYCCVQGWTGGGTGNIDDAPCFVESGQWVDVNDPNIIVEPNDPNAIWIEGNYHLLADSPCIDAGDNSVVTVATDLDGKPRIINSTVDMGAYEFRIIYVDANALPGGDGSSWENAYKYLQEALAVALSGDEIWVAQGIYTPDSNSANSNGSGERTATFQLINGVAIRGGYAGFGEPDPNERDLNIYETVLSGDLDGNDVDVPTEDLLDEPTRGENSYRVVTGSGTDATAVLDGFTITAGNANGTGPYPFTNRKGGGIYIYSGSPTVSNCTFINNFASHSGGGMGNRSSGSTVSNCKFIANLSYYGGGMSNRENGSSMVINCTFRGNQAGNMGGGMYNYGEFTTSLMVTNCSFIENSAFYGGGMFNNEGTDLTITNCTFSGNSSYWDGGGIGIDGDEDGCNSILINCILWANSPDQISLDDATASVTYSDVQGGWLGIGNIDADPCFVESGQWVDVNDPNIIVEPNDPNAFWIDGDYHLKSEGWRWTEELIHDSHWYYDFMTSRCIDAGNPGSPLRDELPSIPGYPDNPYGENIRINMGAYGGTAEASMPPYDWTLLSDITNDGTVDFVDFAHFADIFGDQDDELPGDFNRDGDVDLADLDWLTYDWLLQTSWFQP